MMRSKTRAQDRSELTSAHQIKAFMHCARCLRELPNGTSPRNYAQLEVGWTAKGLQVWCRRHDCNVMHVDFEGHQHPAI
jgi:hypothetical protein